MTTYEAIAERSGGWWAIEVPALPGVFSQVRSLDRAEAMARDAVAMFLDVSPTMVRIEITAMPPTTVAPVVQDALRLRAESEQVQAAATAAMRTAVAELGRAGLTRRDAGRILHVSHQRVAQVAKAAGPAGRVGKDRSGA